MPFFLYASFPNSRIKPRPVTQTANNFHVPIGNQNDATLTLVAPANINRTYIILENLDSLISFYYIYALTVALSPAVVATFGVTNDLAYDSVTGTLYQKQDDGTTINWLVVTIDQVGTLVLPFNSASVDSPQDIYCAAVQNSPAVPVVVVAVDEGSG